MKVVTNVARFRSGMPSTASSSSTRRAAAIGDIASSGIAPSGAFSVIQAPVAWVGISASALTHEIGVESVEASRSIVLTLAIFILRFVHPGRISEASGAGRILSPINRSARLPGQIGSADGQDLIGRF